MKTYLDAENSEVRIEILPLIDVVFCILTFFIIGAVGLTRPEGIEISNAPEAETGKALFKANQLDVQLDLLGQPYIERQPISDEQLKQTVASFVRAKPTGLVVLDADRSTSYEQVIRVLDVLRSVGGNQVALKTQALPKATPDTPSPVPSSAPGSIPSAPAPGQLPTLPGQNGNLSPAPPTPGSTVSPTFGNSVPPQPQTTPTPPLGRPIN